jgi:hypothetical protein
VGKKKLQQLENSGEVFFQEFCEMGPIFGIIPQRPRSGIRTMMK